MEMFGDDAEEATQRYVTVVDDLTALIIERRAEDARALWSLSRSALPARTAGLWLQPEPKA
jgi:hypothetical protein